MSGVTIHNGAVIGAGSVVTKDVEPYFIVVGNPARMTRKRFTDEQIEKLLSISWWDWPQDQNKIKYEALLLWSTNIDVFINRHYKK